MLTLKARGFRHYDFGGWYPGTTDLRLLGMNAFKKGFGGQVIREFDCEEIQTFKGWVVLTVVSMLARAKILERIGSGQSGLGPKPESDIHATAKNCEVSPAF
jgi:hypothetical protein